MADAKVYTKSQQLARGERRYRRKIASPQQWQAIRAAKCSECRVCGRNPIHNALACAIQSHHLIPRDRHGDDVADNIIGLCSTCHNGVEVRDPNLCRLMLARLSDAEYALAVDKAGENFAESVYGISFDCFGVFKEAS